MAEGRYKLHKIVSHQFDQTLKDTSREQEQDKMEVLKKSCKQEENIEMFGNILHYHQEIKLGCHQLVHSEEGKDRVEWTKRTLEAKCKQRPLKYVPEKISGRPG
jgi:hypothetical protein